MYDKITIPQDAGGLRNEKHILLDKQRTLLNDAMNSDSRDHHVYICCSNLSG